MRKGWLMGLCAAVCFSAFAQKMDVKLELAYTVFIVGEPVLVQVSGMNGLRDDIRFAPDSTDRLLFEITTDDPNEYLTQSDARPMASGMVIRTGEPFKQKVELDKWFPLLKEGRYLVRAILLHNGTRYESQKKSFDVVPGILLQEGTQMFVKPPDLKRSFKLVYWHRNKVERLFLSVKDEPTGFVWDSTDLGNLLHGSKPKLDIAPDGVVTVVHKASPDNFIRTVFWSLPKSLEVVERNTLLDPEISASQRAKTLYGEITDGNKQGEKKSWWKFW
ncbi:MAG: hypothetical protein J6336_10960 [Kiritimatiellae bacterium]|nr:hypothetical protein [Kiritimatiellia bacterium]